MMALIRTLTISTTTFERVKGKFDGFRQTVPFVFAVVVIFLLSAKNKVDSDHNAISF